MSYCKLLLEQILERLSSQQKTENIKESGKETSITDTLTRTTPTTTNRDTEYTHTPSAPTLNTIHCSAYLYKRYTDCPCCYCTQFITNIYDYNTQKY